MNRAMLSLAILLQSCSTPTGPTSGEMSEQAIIAIALRYKQARLPEAIVDPKSPQVSDEGRNWRVVFGGPPDAIGGGAVVWIDKNTGKAVRVLGLQ